MKYILMFDYWLSFDEIILIFKWADANIGEENWDWVKQNLNAEINEYPCGIKFRRMEDVSAFSLRFPIERNLVIDD